jgi:hypothetical protein
MKKLFKVILVLAFTIPVSVHSMNFNNCNSEIQLNKC